MAPRLHQKIGSANADLDILNDTYKFIPNAAQVRPSPEEKERKAERLVELIREWKGIEDFIYSTVFSLPHITSTNGVKTVPNRHRERMDRTQCVLQEQQFPYGIEEGEHFVLWYATPQQSKSDEEITADIERKLQSHTRSIDAFQFGWYINPKMTVPEFFHVQVFVGEYTCSDILI